MVEKRTDRLVAYYRVSTKGQGESGLGLEAQQADVKRYAASCGGKVERAFTEIETGKRADRPELAKAIAHARRTGARLVIAKLDRLARNVAFTAALMDNGYDFVCCDMPFANRLTIHILAAVAEAEAVATSARTKAALQAAKARGVKLGSKRANFWTAKTKASWAASRSKANKKSAATRRKQALERVADLLPMIQQMRREGKTLQAIADTLNAEGHTTPRGSGWVPAAVQRALRLVPEAK